MLEQAEGVILAAMVFLMVGLCHPLVVKVEYHIGRRAWWWFLVLALLFLAISILSSRFISLALGAFAAAFFWTSLEIRWQHKRACLGRAKRNPNRPADYYQPCAKKGKC